MYSFISENFNKKTANITFARYLKQTDHSLINEFIRSLFHLFNFILENGEFRSYSLLVKHYFNNEF